MGRVYFKGGERIYEDNYFLSEDGDYLDVLVIDVFGKRRYFRHVMENPTWVRTNECVECEKYDLEMGDCEYQTFDDDVRVCSQEEAGYFEDDDATYEPLRREILEKVRKRNTINWEHLGVPIDTKDREIQQKCYVKYSMKYSDTLIIVDGERAFVDYMEVEVIDSNGEKTRLYAEMENKSWAARKDGTFYIRDKNKTFEALKRRIEELAELHNIHPIENLIFPCEKEEEEMSMWEMVEEEQLAEKIGRSLW